MYSQLKMKARVRVSPRLLGKNIKKSVEQSIIEEIEGVLDPKEGLLLLLIEVESIGDGIIIPGDGAVYYDTMFTMISYQPMVQEIVEGNITEIAEFGAFAKIGPIEGLIHKSQVMDDFISYSNTGTLAGRDTKRVLKINDRIKARVIAANLKNLQTAKVGLTMRQEGLGSESWSKRRK
jgi:DNA-directed RNA polymerase subunit E'